MQPHSIVFKNDIGEIGKLHGYFVALGEAAQIDEFTLDSLNLAVEEAVANVINYAYPEGQEGKVRIDATYDEQQIRFVITDKGVPFDPTKAADADVTLSAEERQIGGLGIHLVRNIMDEMTYERTPEGENVLTLVKKRIPLLDLDD